MASLIPVARTRLASAPTFHLTRHALRSFTSTSTTCKQGPGAGENFIAANDPNPKTQTPNVSKSDEVAIDPMGARDRPLQEYQKDGEQKRELQAPNRPGVWSRSQMPRDLAMTGPRFEQTIIEAQPRPFAAIELIHKQPVRWVNDKSVSCDGGGGPLGHPRIFINVDKPQICWCTYCGLPYAHKHHQKYLESLPKEQLSYPLAPTGDPAQVRMPDSPTQHGEIQGHYPTLKGEVKAEGLSAGGEYTQR